MTADDRPGPRPDHRRRHNLQGVAAALRGLHRQLLDEARRDYERDRGPIPSSAAFLQLLMGDPAFHWLRALSGAMAELDELLDQPGELGPEVVRHVGARFDALVTGDSEAVEFSLRYRECLQRSPDLVMAHAAVRIALRPLS